MLPDCAGIGEPLFAVYTHQENTSVQKRVHPCPQGGAEMSLVAGKWNVPANEEQLRDG